MLLKDVERFKSFVCIVAAEECAPIPEEDIEHHLGLLNIFVSCCTQFTVRKCLLHWVGHLTAPDNSPFTVDAECAPAVNGYFSLFSARDLHHIVRAGPVKWQRLHPKI